MDYILTQNELNELVPKQDKVDRDKALDIARKRILEVSKFPCIHENNQNNYCEGCPCLPTQSEKSAYEFNIGSSVNLRLLHNLICTLRKEFPQ